MSDIIAAIVLGIVEGVTEFLPISSTGHLILANQWFAFSGARLTALFDIVIQFGAIAAVLIVFRRELVVGEAASPHVLPRRWWRIGVGVLPALAVGALFAESLERMFFRPIVVAIALAVGGVVLLAIERRTWKPRWQVLEELPLRTVIGIGSIQCLAFMPGVSRSAATIIGAMLLGCSRELAAKYSFFLAVPTLAAASGYALLKTSVPFDVRMIGLLSLGFVVAFVVAWGVLAVFLRYVRTRSLAPFGWYRIALGVLVLFLLGMQ
ncbi:undecaprenyl-diphosphate phosphatase [Candidatus Uhrbacteria bacterium]|nr:undecaprenyl-diphosphate phosphatase [Candidatus Uhrbacteria bacterium]